MIWFDDEFSALFESPLGMDDMFRIEGEIYRQPPGVNRRTLRFEKAAQGFFLKLHWGVGWKEILKNLTSLRMPVLGARNEWRAIRRLQSLGVETMTLMGYGEQGWNPARRRSFVVTRELDGCISLEDYCAHWVERPPRPREKWLLLERIAEMTRILHDNGVNHRDLYICHFLLRQPWAGRDQHNLHLYLIDLHRVQLRRTTPHRWRVKDIGSLYFSALQIGLTRRDLWRFLKTYFNQPLRPILEQQAKLLEQIEKRARALERKGIPDE